MRTVLADGRKGRLASPRHEVTKDRVEGRGRRLRGVLREKRKDDEALDPRLFELRENGGNRRIPVAGGPVHRNPFALETAPELFGNRLRVNEKRRAFFRPDSTVALGRLRRTHAQNDAVENRPPLPLREFDHALVAQKLREIAPDGRSFRRVGRTRVEKKKGGALAVGHERRLQINRVPSF